MGLFEYASDLYRWWCWEVEGFARRRPDARGAASAVVRVGRLGIEILVPGADPALIQDRTAVGPTIRALAPGSGHGWLDADLLVEPDRHLRRPLSPLRLPRSRAVAMSRLDFAAGTPFRPDEAYLFIPDYDAARPESAYHIVRREHLQPVIDSLRAARIAVRSIGLVEPDRVVPPDRDSAAAAVPPPARERLLRGAARWAALTAAVGLLVAFGVAHWRYATAAGALDREIAAAEEQAQSVRSVAEERDRRISRIAAARSAKSEAVPLVRILEELARTLPDTTWLTEVDLRETTVTFSGISQSAADLIPALEASPIFRSPTFSQQVVRAVDEGGERFTITMAIEDEADG